jgi:membrane-associated phospholipid phosphatase
MIFDADPTHFWHSLTRLGEVQILLPAALLAACALLWQRAGRLLGGWWLGGLAAATVLTASSKIVFIGWGIGVPALDFTGISGHAMFAAAIYPLLFGVLAPAPPHAGRWPAVAAGALLSVLVGVSRVMVQAHSVSEVVAGLTLGGAVSALALARFTLPHRAPWPWLPGAIAVWLALMPAYAPASQTHQMMTRLALALAGHDRPYVRAEL